MQPIDRRSGSRRAGAPTPADDASAPANERRTSTDRRRMPRRRADLRSIQHFASAIEAGEKRLEVIVDGTEGLRLIGMFACGCLASEPVGAGSPSVLIEPCESHDDPDVLDERRQR